MNHDERPEGAPEQDVPFEALRRADPAGTSTPDLARLRALLAARIGEEVPGDAQASASGSSRTAAGAAGVAPVTQLRAGRRRRPVLVAAAAAAAVALGTGGYALGAAVADGPGSRVDYVASAGAPSGSAESAVASDAAATTGDRFAIGSAYIMPVGFGGRARFTGSGLSTSGGSATLWTRGEVDRDEVLARLADVLGVPGAPTSSGGERFVGSADWSGPRLAISESQQDAGVSYSDPAAWVGEGCVALPEPLVEPDAGEEAAASSTGTGADACEPVEDPGAAPGKRELIRRTNEILEAAGVDPGAYDVRVERTGSEASVTATPEDGIAPEARSWTLSFTSKGLRDLYGSVAPLVEVGEQPVVSPADAVARIADQVYSLGYVHDTDVAVRSEAGAATPAQRVGTGDGRLPWKVSAVTITQARLVHTSVWTDDGAHWVVPAYRLSDAEGHAWQVLALADEALDRD